MVRQFRTESGGRKSRNGRAPFPSYPELIQVVVQVLVKQIVPLCDRKRAEGQRLLSIEMTCAELLRLLDEVDQALFFGFEVAGLVDLELGSGRGAAFVGLFARHDALGEDLCEEATDGAGFWEVRVIHRFIGLGTMRKHLPDRHLAPNRAGVRFQILDSIDHLLGDVEIKDVFHRITG